jgi:hypothetical protein
LCMSDDGEKSLVSRYRGFSFRRCQRICYLDGRSGSACTDEYKNRRIYEFTEMMIDVTCPPKIPDLLTVLTVIF